MTSVSFDRRLLDAVVAVADGLDLEPTLRRIVRAASDLTNAPYAALGVLDEEGHHKAFVHTGVDEARARAIGAPPHGVGVLGHITRVGRAVRVDDLPSHPSAAGFPPHHPVMRSFLGVPVGIGDRVVGNLYLADKAGGFTAEDEDVVVALAAAAAVAVENAELYGDVRRRERWLAAAQEVSTTMLSGAEDDQALHLIATLATEVAEADMAALVLAGWGGQWVLELAVGEGADELVGTVMPDDGRAATVIRLGRGMLVPDLATDPQMKVERLRRFGPAMYAPLQARDERIGVLMVARRVGGHQFTRTDLATAQIFAGQAALALQLADGRRRAEENELLDERARIARDLHDLVVQELFAMGMRLSRLRERLDPDELADVDTSLESLDRVVRQIRATIRALRDPDERAGLADRVHAEAARSHAYLGFRPEVVVEIADELDPDELVDGEIADDLIAVIREGLSNAARHAHASAVQVRLAITRREVRAEVRDDGAGMPAEFTRRSGLDNLTERARRHDGRCEALGNADGTGSTLRWSVPLGHPTAAGAAVRAGEGAP